MDLNLIMCQPALVLIIRYRYTTSRTILAWRGVLTHPSHPPPLATGLLGGFQLSSAGTAAFLLLKEPATCGLWNNLPSYFVTGNSSSYSFKTSLNSFWRSQIVYFDYMTGNRNTTNKYYTVITSVRITWKPLAARVCRAPSLIFTTP